MKKRFGFYIAVWAVLLAVFNVIAFASVDWTGQEQYTPSFWIGYAMVSVAFLGQLACAYFALKDGSAQKLFYRLTLVQTSCIGLAVMFVLGGLCMLISRVLGWLAAILCLIVLAVDIITVLKATAAVNEVERIDTKVKNQTFFIKSLTADAEVLLARATNETIKAECKKVYEAVRYSDPMSVDALSSMESQISIRFAALSDAVTAENTAMVVEETRNILILLKDRNNKCKMLK